MLFLYWLFFGFGLYGVVTDARSIFRDYWQSGTSTEKKPSAIYSK